MMVLCWLDSVGHKGGRSHTQPYAQPCYRTYTTGCAVGVCMDSLLRTVGLVGLAVGGTRFDIRAGGHTHTHIVGSLTRDV